MHWTWEMTIDLMFTLRIRYQICKKKPGKSHIILPAPHWDLHIIFYNKVYLDVCTVIQINADFLKEKSITLKNTAVWIFFRIFWYPKLNLDFVSQVRTFRVSSLKQWASHDWKTQVEIINDCRSYNSLNIYLR